MTVGPPRSPLPYPFAELDEAKLRAADEGIDLIDFGVGDPMDPTPDFIRQALVDGIDPVSSYPRAAGLPELRAAISNWLRLRFEAHVAAGDILPTIGSKEIIHSLPAYVLDDERDTVVVPSPAYPVYERGATFHGARLHTLPLEAGRGFLPDLDSVPDDVWRRTALLWLNYPNNPTGAVAPLALYKRAADIARTHGFVLASDEAYSEIAFGDPPASALQLDSHDNVVVVNTLSKRSCMTGYRSGFIAGDPALIDRLRVYRPSVGVTPQAFVQRASIAAWNDEAHVVQQLRRWAEKRDTILPVLRAAGLQVRSEATFFLWIALPEGETAERFAKRLLSVGIVVSPGTFFGPEGEGYVRMALVPSTERCREAARRLSAFLNVKESL